LYLSTNKLLIAINNLLFDPDSFQITALLDFDFPYIGTATEEFLGFSFTGMYGGQLPGPDSEPFELLIREAMLSGFPASLSTFDSEESKRQWELAKAWHVELARSGAARPQTIELFDKIADIYWLADNLSPFDLENKYLREQNTKDQLKTRREEIAHTVEKFLGDAGF